MKAQKKIRAGIVACMSSLVLAGSVHAFVTPEKERLPDVDKRKPMPRVAKSMPADKAGAVARLRAAAPETRVDFDPIVGSPKWIASPHGFLTGPDGQGLSAESIALFPAQDPHRVGVLATRS